jgi:hypothetical protein
MATNGNRRITVVVPADLIEAAMEVTGKNATETVIAGLWKLRQMRAYSKLLAAQGKVKIDLDLDESRGRRRSR